MRSCLPSTGIAKSEVRRSAVKRGSVDTHVDATLLHLSQLGTKAHLATFDSSRSSHLHISNTGARLLASNKMKTPPQLPPRLTTTSISLIEDAQRLISHSCGVQDQIVSTVQNSEQATFTNTLLPLAHNEKEVALHSNIINFYQSVSADPQLRDASRRTKQLLNKFDIESASREDIFLRVEAIVKNTQPDELDTEGRLLLEKEYKKYSSNCLGLPAGPLRDRFKEIKKRISELQLEFQTN